MRTLIFLDEIGFSDSIAFGEEAVLLGNLTKAAVPVSPAFLLPTQAYGEYVSAAAVKDVLDRGGLRGEEEVRQTLLASAIPRRLGEEIKSFYRSLSGPRNVHVSVRSPSREVRADGPESLVSSIRQIWVDHILSVLGRDGNVFKESLPIIVQQITDSSLFGTLYTSDPHLGSLDLCLVEVVHKDGVEKIVFEKGTGKLVRRNVFGSAEEATGVGGFEALASWARKIEQILGGAYRVGWNIYQGEVAFEKVGRMYIPQARASTLELWLDAESGDLNKSKGVSGFVARDGALATRLARDFPGHRVLLLLDSAHTEQLEHFRQGRHKLNLKNLHVVLPPIRTVDGLREIKRYLSGERVQRGPNLEFFFRAHYPSNIVLLERFVEIGVDGVLFDEGGLSRGFLGVDEDVEPDESITWAIGEAGKKCQRAEVDMLYLSEQARPWVLLELAKGGAKGVVVPQKLKSQFVETLQEADRERLTSGD